MEPRSRRPPLFTALAIVLFVFAFLLLTVGSVAPYLLRATPDEVVENAPPEDRERVRALRDAYADLGDVHLALLAACSAATGGLLLLTGVGLLRRSERLSRSGGTAAAVSIAVTLAVFAHVLAGVYAAGEMSVWSLQNVLLAIVGAVVLLVVHGPLRRHFVGAPQATD